MALPASTTPKRIHSDRVWAYVAPSPGTGADPDEGDYVLMHQVTNYSSTMGGENDEWRTFGSGKQTELDSYDDSFNLTVLRGESTDEKAKILGFDTGTLSPGDEINLRGSNKVFVRLDYWSKAGSLVGQKLIKEISWESVEGSQDADGFDQDVFTGNCDLVSDIHNPPQPT